MILAGRSVKIVDRAQKLDTVAVCHYHPCNVHIGGIAILHSGPLAKASTYFGFKINSVKLMFHSFKEKSYTTLAVIRDSKFMTSKCPRLEKFSVSGLSGSGTSPPP